METLEMVDDKENCPGCPDAGTLDFSTSRVMVPDDFMADKLGTMEQQVAEGMAVLERIGHESPPHSPQLETPTIQPGLIREPHTADFTGDPRLEAPAIITGKNFSTAETDAAPIVPIQFQRAPDDDEKDGEKDEKEEDKPLDPLRKYEEGPHVPREAGEPTDEPLDQLADRRGRVEGAFLPCPWSRLYEYRFTIERDYPFTMTRVVQVSSDDPSQAELHTIGLAWLREEYGDEAQSKAEGLLDDGNFPSSLVPHLGGVQDQAALAAEAALKAERDRERRRVREQHPDISEEDVVRFVRNCSTPCELDVQGKYAIVESVKTAYRMQPGREVARVIRPAGPPLREEEVDRFPRAFEDIHVVRVEWDFVLMVTFNVRAEVMVSCVET
jgi:hypothetical protein